MWMVIQLFDKELMDGLSSSFDQHCNRALAIWISLKGSALVNIRRKALGHLMKFTRGRLKYT